jgi:hypothetical protein
VPDAVIYQDSAYTDQFYYQPQEFRLPRLDISPYLPDLKVAFYEVATQDEETGGDQAKINYKVRLAYRALPHIHPLLLERAQKHISELFPGIRANFKALAPTMTILNLRLPQDTPESDATDVELTDVQRPNVEVRFDQGIVDEIELSRTQFEHIFTLFQSPDGVGIEGHVEASLLGNEKAEVKVSLSLKQTTSRVFGHTYTGPLGDGRHQVRLINRIESPVTIEGIYSVALGGGAFARPQDTPGQTVQPGGQLDLYYRLDPVTAVGIDDINPSLAVSIDVDARSLWPKLFVNEGYTSETYKVTVTTEAGSFGAPPPGRAPLTGLLVEFGHGNKITLTADQLQADVQLRIPLLSRLLEEAYENAMKYRYQVTNLHGEDSQAGATSEWINGEGDGELPISRVEENV